VNTILRTDFGEMGRADTRLTILNRGTYGIAFTITEYTRHIYLTEDGPLGIKSRKTDYYYYCEGKPAISSEGATELQRTMLLDKDVADFTEGLAR
jgi:hypothetical protein